MSRIFYRLFDSFGDLLDFSSRDSMRAQIQMESYVKFLSQKSDEDNLRADFTAVGDSIKSAISKYETEDFVRRG